MDYLFLLCEMAVGFAGFTAVVAVFQPEGDPEEHRLNKVRLQQMLELSLLTIGAGVLPFLLFSFGLTENDASRVAAAVMLPGWAVLMFLQIRWGFDQRVQRLPGYNVLYARFLVGLGIVCLVAWAMAAIDARNPTAWYRVGITALIVVAGLQFFRTATSALRVFRDGTSVD